MGVNSPEVNRPVSSPSGEKTKREKLMSYRNDAVISQQEAVMQLRFMSMTLTCL